MACSILLGRHMGCRITFVSPLRPVERCWLRVQNPEMPCRYRRPRLLLPDFRHCRCHPLPSKLAPRVPRIPIRWHYSLHFLQRYHTRKLFESPWRWPHMSTYQNAEWRHNALTPGTMITESYSPDSLSIEGANETVAAVLERRTFHNKVIVSECLHSSHCSFPLLRFEDEKACGCSQNNEEKQWRKSVGKTRTEGLKQVYIYESGNPGR